VRPALRAPGDDLGDVEIEKILWAIATAAAGVLEGHLPRLQAIVERRRAAEVGYRRSSNRRALPDEQPAKTGHRPRRETPEETAKRLARGAFMNAVSFSQFSLGEPR
jgi:hypothetical protein